MASRVEVNTEGRAGGVRTGVGVGLGVEVAVGLGLGVGVGVGGGTDWVAAKSAWSKTAVRVTSGVGETGEHALKVIINANKSKDQASLVAWFCLRRNFMGPFYQRIGEVSRPILLHCAFD